MEMFLTIRVKNVWSKTEDAEELAERLEAAINRDSSVPDIEVIAAGWS